MQSCRSQWLLKIDVSKLSTQIYREISGASGDSGSGGIKCAPEPTFHTMRGSGWREFTSKLPQINILAARGGLSGVFNIKIWMFYIKNRFKNDPGPRGLHFHPFSAQTEPRRPMSDPFVQNTHPYFLKNVYRNLIC